MCVCVFFLFVAEKRERPQSIRVSENSSKLTRAASLSRNRTRTVTHAARSREDVWLCETSERITEGETGPENVLEDDSILGTVIRNARLPHDHVTLCILAPVSSTPQTFDSSRFLYRVSSEAHPPFNFFFFFFLFSRARY